jgi:hypothetical protein
MRIYAESVRIGLAGTISQLFFRKSPSRDLLVMRGTTTAHGAPAGPLVSATKERIAMSGTPNHIGRSRIEQQTAVQSTIDGLTKHAQALPSIVIAGTTYPTSDLIAILQTRLDALNAAETARAAWQAAVQRDYAQRTGTKGILSGIRQATQVAFAGHIDVLADFGLVGRKPAVISPETRVAAAQKAKATRAARHTMGPKQKAAIKGDVTGVSVTPITAPAAPTVAPAPSATPASPAPTPPSATPAVVTAANGH